MKIEITPKTQAVINQFMATGRYANEAEALEAALDDRIDPETGMTIGRLKAELQKGLDDAAAGRLLPASEVWEKLAQRFQHVSG